MAYIFHCGIDLGSKRSQIAIIDNEQRVILNEKLENDMVAICHRLSAFSGQVQAVVESTSNWYWPD